MLNFSLSPTQPEPTDSLFDLTENPFNILPESDNLWNIFDSGLGIESDRGDAVILPSQLQASDLNQISALEIINAMRLDRADDRLLPGFVQEQSLTDRDLATIGTENDAANSSISDRAIGVKQSTPAGLTFNLSFDDPTRKYAPYYAAIQSSIIAAGLDWNQYIQGKGSLEISVKFSLTGDAVASGRSLATSAIRNNGKYSVYESGVTTELRTGIDPNGASPDIEFNIDPDDLTKVLWFDPNPSTRTTPVPTNKIDAVSVFLHEFGHAIGFNGWKSDTDGTLPGNYQSTFDEKINFDGTNFFFAGPRATAVYGAPVPLNFGNITHLGNDAPRPGSDLSRDLMNPYVSDYGTRVGISTLDLAILADTGVPIASARNNLNNYPPADSLWRNIDGRVMNSANALATGSLALAEPLPADSLWRNIDGRVMNSANALATGSLALAEPLPYLTAGLRQQQQPSLGKIDPFPVGNDSWSTSGLEDFDREGQTELLWRNTDGSTNFWELNGTNVFATGAIDPTPLMSVDRLILT